MSDPKEFLIPPGLDIESFEVREDKDGRDCDGPIYHGGHSGVMTNKEIMEYLGYLTVSHTKIRREKGSVWDTWYFSRDTEEGCDSVTFSVKHARGTRDE
jgi:hypothetical protein